MSATKSKIKRLEALTSRYEQEIELLHEQVRLLRAQLYGRRAEQFARLDPTLPLFELPPAPVEPSAGQKEEEIVVPEHNRKKRGRKALPEDLPRVDVIHDVTEEEKRCGCGNTKACIGEEVSEQLDIVPAEVRVLRHVRPKYACRHCEGVEGNSPTVVVAPPPAQIIPKAMASAGLIAQVIVSKFVDALPFYRQEGIFARIGIEIGRTTMCNWAFQVAEKSKPLIDLLWQEIRGGPYASVDETTTQVLQETGRAPTTTSYMWIFRGGDPERPAIIFDYHPTRDGGFAAARLRGYEGYVQTDGYSGYDFLDHQPGVTHLGCWTHARRKFVEVVKAAGVSEPGAKTGVASEALDRIGALYAIEKQARANKLTPEEIYAKRQEKAKPILTEFHAWLRVKVSEAPPKSLLGKAIGYALNQWKRLTHYILDGRLRPDNNLTENAIRPFVVGRKNWLFSATPEGAAASATLYSLIETAKANGLNPYWYLRRLFERLPLAKAAEELRALLPQYIDRALLTPA